MNFGVRRLYAAFDSLGNVIGHQSLVTLLILKKCDG